MSGLRALAALPPAKIADTAQRALAERFAPASVLIDRSHRILYFHGPTELFLTQPSGEPTQVSTAWRAPACGPSCAWRCNG